MNTNTFLTLSILFFLYLSCSKKDQFSDDSTAGISFENTPRLYVNERSGDTVVIGVPVPARGKRIAPDSVEKPKTFPVRSALKAGRAPTNVYPAGKPHVVTVPKELPVITPGKGDFPAPKTVPAPRKMAPTSYPQPTPALPSQKKVDARYNLQSWRLEQGMLDDYVQALLVDRKGYLWIATRYMGGASRFDGHSFTHFTTKEGLSSQYVSSMEEDRQGNMWFGTDGRGVIRYDGHRFTYFTTENGLTNDFVTCIEEDSQGNIWIGTKGGGVNRYDGDRFTHFTTKEGLTNDFVGCIEEDSKGNLWFGTGGGVNRYDGHHIARFSTEEGLSHNLVLSILEDSRGNMWFGTAGGGVNRYDPQANGGQGSFTHITVKEGLTNNHVTSIAEDSQGNLWFGTGISWWTGGGGLNRYSSYDFTSLSIHEDPSKAGVWSIIEDKRGRLWFGTSGGGAVCYDESASEEEDRLTYLTAEQGLGHDFIQVIVEDSRGNLWFGTNGGGVTRFDGQNLTRFTTKEGLSSDLVWSILEDSRGNMWFGTLPGGVSLYDPDAYNGQGSFTHFTTKEGLIDNSIITMAEDDYGRIWLGTLQGLSRYEPPGMNGESSEQGSFTHLFMDDDLLSNIYISILKDGRGNIWLERGPSISRYKSEANSKEAGNLIHYLTEEQVGNNILSSIQEDRQGNIWINTLKGGIFLLAPNLEDPLGDEYQIFTFDREDGLTPSTESSVYLDRSNRIWWGTRAGVSMLDLNNFKLPLTPPRLALDYLLVKDEYVDFRRLVDTTYANQFTFGKVLRESFDSVAAFGNYPIGLDLPHYMNNLAFHVSAIDWAGPQKTRYQFLMEGQDEDWRPPQSKNFAVYNNLSYGLFTLKVRAIGVANVWSEPIEYTFTIHPPWWRTWWAYSLYIVLILAALYSFYRFQLNRKLLAAEAVRLQEMDTVKTRLYTNITHEFRTPLTVISGMADQIGENPGKWLHQGLAMIQRNCHKLLNLVNQMLDLSRLESGSMPVHLRQDDVIVYLKYLAESFHAYAAGKDIRLHFISDLERLVMDFDAEKMRQIVSNLLSNAIKFTPEGGDVYLEVAKNAQEDQLVLKIRDTGIGIPEDELPHIFDRFHQVATQQRQPVEGTGVGLALTSELVKLLQGEIAVESRLEEGTVFKVRLPISRQAPPVDIASERPAATPVNDLPAEPVNQLLRDDAWEDDLPLILIAEDNKDLVRYLTACLENRYRLEIARNGREGIARALELIPDIIISDVMMPEMDGYELCQRLKEDQRTSHIPIILLTAKADQGSKIEGFRKGADAYLTKPFDKEELFVRLRQLIALRQVLQSKYNSSSFVIETTSQKEDEFIIKFRKLILDNLDDHIYGIPQLCRALHISRMHLHRKIKALTDKTPAHFIRQIRLREAQRLLLETQMNISEIAYEVGFKDPSYFTRVFVEAFGKSPRTMREERGL